MDFFSNFLGMGGKDKDHEESKDEQVSPTAYWVNQNIDSKENKGNLAYLEKSGIQTTGMKEDGEMTNVLKLNIKMVLCKEKNHKITKIMHNPEGKI